MGIRKDDIEMFDKILASKGLLPSGLKMMQFGDMDLRDQVGRASDYFRKRLGMEVVNIDINGEHDALPIDLGQPIKWLKYKGNCDIVTNYGTLEHVKDDTIGYRNADYFLKHGGLFFNIAPVQSIGYRYHRHCHKYTNDWFNNWSVVNKYNVLVNRIIVRGNDDWIECILEKQ